MSTKQMSRWIIAKENPTNYTYAARIAVAAVLSLWVARLIGMPEAYWASITSLVIIQPTFKAALPISVQQFAGTAVGAICGWLVATYIGANIFVYGVAIFVIGMACSALHVERSAFRYASVTLAIIVLIVRTNPPSVVALHRFVEVSVGIVMSLVLTAVWPDKIKQG